MKLIFVLSIVAMSVLGYSQNSLTITDNDLKITNTFGKSTRYPLYDVKYRIDETDSTIVFSSSGGVTNRFKLADITITGQSTSIDKMRWISSALKGTLSVIAPAQDLTQVGTVSPVTILVTSLQTLTTTDAMIIMIENIGGANGTIIEGGVSVTLPTGVAYTYERVLDSTSNKYSPFPTLSVNGTGTSIKVTTYKKQ